MGLVYIVEGGMKSKDEGFKEAGVDRMTQIPVQRRNATPFLQKGEKKHKKGKTITHLLKLSSTIPCPSGSYLHGRGSDDTIRTVERDEGVHDAARGVFDYYGEL